MPRQGEKNRSLSNVFISIQKAKPVIDDIMIYIGFEKTIFATKMIVLIALISV